MQFAPLAATGVSAPQTLPHPPAVLDHKIFQFYFSSNQTARPRQCWRLCGKPKLKKIEKNFSIFQ
jgi:hypothetical protein